MENQKIFLQNVCFVLFQGVWEYAVPVQNFHEGRSSGQDTPLPDKGGSGW